MKLLKLFGLALVVIFLAGCVFIYPQERTPEPPTVEETYAQATQSFVLTSTPNPTEEPTKTPIPTIPVPTPTATSATEYVVKEKDTLSGIAETYGTSVDLLAITNDDIDYIDLIFPGQVIEIPNPLDIPEPRSQTGKEIVIKTSTQQLFAFEDGKLINDFIVSTGLLDTPTPEGEFFIQSRYESAPMTGPGYNFPNVPSVMYYSGSYGIHGTTWHNNFGQPMSHGCTNMSVEDAKWLFDWTPVQTRVTVVVQ